MLSASPSTPGKSPSQLLSVLLTLFCGLVLGFGIFTFVYARGFSYLTNQPSACRNCHIMNDQYDSWIKSSHRAVAGCNDCHTPGHFVGKMWTKAQNGLWHSIAFTSGHYPFPVQIKPHNQRIVQQSCLKCHKDLFHAITALSGGEQKRTCTHCHRDVGHLH